MTTRLIKRATAAFNLASAGLCFAVCIDSLHRAWWGEAAFSGAGCVVMVAAAVIFWREGKRNGKMPGVR